MKGLRSIVPVALLSLGALAGCSDDSSTEGPTAKPVFEEARSSLARDTSAALDEADGKTFRDGNASFAFDMHKRLAAKGGNVALSPYSITTALAMTYAGARGETESEMATALHYSLGQEKTHVGMNAMMRGIEANAGLGKAIDGSPLKLAVDNAMFLQKGSPFEKPYLDLIATQYGAGLKLADFVANAESERGRINDWVASNTNDRIKDLIGKGSLDPTTRFVLVNTIYMNAAWESPFDPNDTIDGQFTAEDGAALTPKMMSSKFSAPYAETDAAQLVTLRYSGGKLSMTAILPKGTLADFEKSLDAKGFDALLAARKDDLVSVTMPRFKVAGDTVSLVEEFRALGMNRAFDSADFSGMSTMNLSIADILHKAFIDVAEKGTEAAAATAVIGREMSAPVEQPKSITFNKPFFVAIRDEGTGAILFTARVARP